MSCVTDIVSGGDVATPEPEPDVSLIMTAWEPRRDWLADAVDSALGQRDVRIELILVDDGCPRPVEDLLEQTDPRLRHLRIAHSGVCAARNRGIQEARGRYLRFIDADDVIHPDSTARLLELTGGADDVIPYGTTIRCDEHLRPVRELTSDLEGDVVKACLLSKFTVRHMSMLFPRAVIERSGVFDPEFPASGDWDFVLRALEHATVRRSSIPATYYRTHGGQITANIPRCEAGMELVIKRFVERHPQYRGSSLERMALAEARLKSARSYRGRGDHGDALRRVADAAKLAPVPTMRRVARWGYRSAVGRARRIATAGR
ncbi:MAG: glycosyltransferase [Actinobacteria bacterium]|nr:MAG: glycosyltransferase [Actinomycetota bacterium]